MPLIVGAPLLLLLLAATSLPWLLVFRARYGQFIAVPATVGGAVLLGFAVLMLSHLLRVNYMVATIVASSGRRRRVPAGATDAGVCAARADTQSRCGARRFSAACLDADGRIAQVLPGASRFGWAMNGDSLNNLYYAHVMVIDNGVALGAHENPVPLPADSHRHRPRGGHPSSASASAALAHELSAFTLVWVLLLVLTCLGLGVVARVARRSAA